MILDLVLGKFLFSAQTFSISSEIAQARIHLCPSKLFSSYLDDRSKKKRRSCCPPPSSFEQEGKKIQEATMMIVLNMRNNRKFKNFTNFFFV
ncbi:hypothetical protein DERF_012106 [Dermatophagoides farinae]|uniref:Uncharacterized protein n=1 Tax=Dermatophagoides farinae TaxID=6954 RepID=A0A922HRB0_DERFA|nr:hypothetical protein DERF_012106 [Dermatophagoides farinae]